MNVPVHPSTLIPAKAEPQNPLATILRSMSRELASLADEMVSLTSVARPTKGEAQELVSNLLTICGTVDRGLLAIGREARSHFGHHVGLSYFTDQLRGAIEGHATFEICDAVEQAAEWAEETRSQYQIDLWRS